MVHRFSGCILGSAVECDLDELLATRLVSFLLDHQERILSVPEYLLSAINNHIQYLRAVQVGVLHPGAFGELADHDSTFNCELALLTRFPLTVRWIVMAVIRLRFLSPFTPSAIRLAVLSLNSKSWRPPRRPWRSCWRCSWQTKT